MLFCNECYESNNRVVEILPDKKYTTLYRCKWCKLLFGAYEGIPREDMLEKLKSQIISIEDFKKKMKHLKNKVKEIENE